MFLFIDSFSEKIKGGDVLMKKNSLFPKMIDN